MNPFLEQGLALGLAVGQIVATPNAVKLHFDPVTEQAQALDAMKAGCAALVPLTGVNVNIDALEGIADQLLGQIAEARQGQLPRGLTIPEIKSTLHIFCRGLNEDPEGLKNALTFYNQALANLPDANRIRLWRLPGYSTFLAASGGGELSVLGRRRRIVPFDAIPKALRDAIVAVEDKKFWDHRGIDPMGIFRAAHSSATSGGRSGGGSTITQQTVKNTFFGETFHAQTEMTSLMARKIAEIVLASAIEEKRILTKNQILELYLNLIYFGRGAYGVAEAAQSYFGKDLSSLTVAECAMLAGLAQGPARLDPARSQAASYNRTFVVLSQMRSNGLLSAEDYRSAAVGLQPMIAAAAAFTRRPPAEASTASVGQYFLDLVRREIQTRTAVDVRETPAVIQTTMDRDIQLGVERELQEGLAKFEMTKGRATFNGPERNIAAEVARLSEAPPAPSGSATPPAPRADALPAWQRALRRANLPLSDVHWARAVVVPPPPPQPAPPPRAAAAPVPPGQRRPAQPQPQPPPAPRFPQGRIVVGLEDGRLMPLNVWNQAIYGRLRPYDVVYVVPGRTGADLRARPQIQGAAVVMESQTGRVLGLSGGFSYQLSQLNRVVDTRRQPGSTAKPLTYLAALAAGIQPNAPVFDGPVELPMGNRIWSPNNDTPSANDSYRSLRSGLMWSVNRMTGNLLKMINPDPARSLDMVLTEMRQCGMYANLGRFYPNILGATETRVLDVATCYAALANYGARPRPHLFTEASLQTWTTSGETRQGLLSQGPEMRRMSGADELAFFQLRTVMQDVTNGTGSSLKTQLQDLANRRPLSDFIAGKTGTSQMSNDVWFVGYTKDVVIAVWVGYDNGIGQRRQNLAGATGGEVAAPIFGRILRAVAQKRPLEPFPDAPESVTRLATQINPGGAIPEFIRRDGAYQPPPPPAPRPTEDYSRSYR